MKDKNINIEKVLNELESIVNKMEEDNLNLEDSSFIL
jgi:exonuclease VII small subunit